MPKPGGSIRSMPTDRDPAAIMARAHELREAIRRAVKDVRYHHAIGEPAPTWVLGLDARTWEVVMRRLHRR